MGSLVELIRQTYAMARPRERAVVMNNVAALSVLQVITYLLPLLIIPYLFRVLGPDKFGLIAFAQAFAQYFIVLTNYGFNVSATKKISLCRDDPVKVARVFSSVMIIKTGLTCLSVAALGLAVYFIPKFRNDWPVYVLGFATVFGNVLFPTWFFQGIERMNYITNLNMAAGLAGAAVLFIFVQGPQDYLLVLLINSLGVILIGLGGQWIAAKKFRVAFRWQPYRYLRQQWREGWDVFISVAAINAYTTTRVFLLGLLTNNNITGFYSIAEKIANTCQTFPLDSFSQAIFPRLSKIFHREKNKAFNLMRRIQRITVMIAMITLPVVIVFADLIVKIVCGGVYKETVLALRLLIVAVFFVSANAFRVQFLLVCGKTQIYSRIHVTMAFLGLPLLFVLINSLSYLGAAAATIIIEAGVFMSTSIAVKNLRFKK